MAVLAAKGLNDKTVGFHKLTNKSRRAESNNECKITKLSLLCNKEIGDCNQRERDRTNKHGEVNRAWSMRGNDQLYHEPARDQLDVSKKWGTARDGLQLLVLMGCTLFIAWLTAWTFFVFVYVHCSRTHNVWSFLALVHHLLYSMLAHILYIMLVSFICMSYVLGWLKTKFKLHPFGPAHPSLYEIHLRSFVQPTRRQFSETSLNTSPGTPTRCPRGCSLVVTFRHGYAYHTYPYKHTFMDLPVMHEVQQIWTVSPRVSCTPLEPIQGSRVLLVVVGEIYR